SPAWPSLSRSCPSTSSATGCATHSIPEATGEPMPNLTGHRTRQEAFHFMKRRSMTCFAAVGAAAALALAPRGGCGSSGTTCGGGLSSASGFNPANNNVVNPSTKKGRPIVFDNSSGPDSADAGNAYYAFNLNFTRLYAPPLTTYKRCPGYTCGGT